MSMATKAKKNVVAVKGQGQGKRRWHPAGGDWIHLHRVQVQCVLGVYPAERERVRPVWMDISLECDMRAAAKSDQLEDALDYEQIEAAVVGMAKKARFRLVETLAAHVAEACLKHPMVRSARVVVEKPGALPLTQSVSVEIIRSK
jgi:7,8-dihydroneopterin aldolase/epimerase/oxygenase